MLRKMRSGFKWIVLIVLFSPLCALAGNVEILAAKFSRQVDQSWTVSVTLQHADSGWDHYADAWKVVDAKGTSLGLRTLFHPHVDEQPFTRSLGSVKIPAGLKRVFIEAHDKVHGWSRQRLEIDLDKVRNGQLQVRH